MTLRDALREAAARIQPRDAEVLLAHVLGRERTWLLAHPEAEIKEAQRAGFLSLVTRRAQGTPLQYITGVQEFFGLSLRVSPAVLIPRPETEHLVEAVLAWAATQAAQNGPMRIADAGTGSGAIALALAAHLPHAEIYATDISAAALEVARDNAMRLGLAARTIFALGDLLSPFGAALESGMRFDAVASNPPYVSRRDATTMQREVVEHEPHTALFAGENGLEVYRRLAPAARAALRPGGLLAMEIGFGQRDAISRLLEGWGNVRFIEDYAGIPRVVLAES